jgi:hypothetical protein
MDPGVVLQRRGRVALAQVEADRPKNLESCGGVGVGPFLEVDLRGIVQSEACGVEANLGLRLSFEEVQPFVVKK